MRRIWLYVLAVSGGMSLIGGCPPGVGPTATPTPGPIAQMNEDERFAAIDAANTKFASLQEREPAAARQEMVDFLNARPEFEGAGVHGTEVFAHFPDGVLVIFINNRDPADLDAAKAAAGVKELFRRGVPQSADAYIADGMGTCFSSAATAMCRSTSLPAKWP